MKKYLYDYIEKQNKLIKSNKKITDEIINEHLIKISFFKHERLIHLLVTLFYALFMLVFLTATVIWKGFFVIVIALLIFLIFYVIHYFRLENGVQYLYRQYDMLNEKRSK